MYGKPAITCFKYQLCQYSSEAITYLNATHGVITEPTLWFIKLKTCMIEEPSHVKQLSLSHMFKIGLRKNCDPSFAAKKEILYDIIILVPLSRTSRTTLLPT
jgi:hypothetical protein